MAFSKLLGRDAQEVTPAQAGAAFSEEAKRIAREGKIDFSEAWTAAKKLHPEAFARLCEGAQPTTTLANDGMTPVSFQFYLPRMGLPASTTKEEFNIIWRANGSKAFPVDKKAIFAMLVGFYISTQKVAAPEARQMVEKKFPSLTDADQQN